MDLSKITNRIDAFQTELGEKLDELRQDTESRLESLTTTEVYRTTWPRRMFWLLLGAGAGAATAFLMDPDRGTARRSEFGDQFTARSRDVRDELEGESQMVRDRLKGAAAQTATTLAPQPKDNDPHTLRNRIRSEVFGNRDDVQDVVLKVDDSGGVAIKGTVPDHRSEDELVSLVKKVDGVRDVRSELRVATG